MDIYSFIRSRDVAEHCRNIGKTWNTCEMAIIIASSDRTIDEKHTAWQELVDCYPDAPSIPNYHKIQFESTHKRLAEIMDYERRLVKFFKTPEEGMYYTYCIHRIHFDVGNNYHSRSFTSFEKAVASAKQRWEKDEAPEISFDRIPIDAADDYDRRIEARTDYDGNMYYIHASAYDAGHAKWFSDIDYDKLWEYDIASVFFIDIPLPFKRGDLLTCSSYSSDAFVFDNSPASDPKQYAKYLCGEMGDGGDMGGWCFHVDDAGVLYGEHTISYDAFEYFKGELKGKERLLHYVSLFIKGEIGLLELLNMQCRLVAEHLSDEHCINIPKDLLAENR